MVWSQSMMSAGQAVQEARRRGWEDPWAKPQGAVWFEVGSKYNFGVGLSYEAAFAAADLREAEWRKTLCRCQHGLEHHDAQSSRCIAGDCACEAYANPGFIDDSIAQYTEGA
jgi:hypothetical protein